MVTPEQAERYEVEAINIREGWAISAHGDRGPVTMLLDDEGMECDVQCAVSAIVEWPEATIVTLVHLCDYVTQLPN